MKRFLTYIMAGAILLTFARCTSLDLEPESTIADSNYWKDAAQVDAFNQGLHALLRERSYTFFILGEPRADYYSGEMSFTGSGTPGLSKLWTNTIDRISPQVSNYGDFYVAINQLNLMIKKMQEVESVTEATKAYYSGEAYGMRAFLYFHILRSWGDAIIWTDYSDGNSLNPGNLDKAASSEAEVMAQILNDIKRSEEAFANNTSFLSGKRHYWSKAATLMLKGEVYLWKGRNMQGGNEDYKIAKNALMEVKAIGFELQPFADVFSYSKKNNKEIIFAIYNGQDEYSLWNNSYANNMLPLQAQLYDGYVDETGESFKNLPIGDLVGTNYYPFDQDFYVKGFHDIDTRKRGTLQAAYLKDDPAVLGGVYPVKFAGTKLTGAATRRILNDYPIYRYSDCLLLLATAKAFLNEDIAAEINEVRKRAYTAEVFAANESTLAYPNDNDADLYENNKYMKPDNCGDPIEIILKERMREFVVEGKRWYDLRLMGYDYLRKYTTGVNSKNQLYWPIDINTTTNNNLLEDKYYK